jgi:hypothetical protein
MRGPVVVFRRWPMVVAIAASCVLVVSAAVAAEMPGTVQFAPSTGAQFAQSPGVQFASSRAAQPAPSPGVQFAPSTRIVPAGSVLRLSAVEPVGAPLPAARFSPPAPQLPPQAVQRTAALVRQPDAPRAPVVQPVPLPPPTEGIAPGTPLGQQVSPPNYGDYTLRPIGSLTINIAPKEGQVPREVNPTKTLEKEFGTSEFQRAPLDYSYMWESPAFFNRPLYFEQPNLERYGYDWGISQFWISGAQFFVKIPLLPYMMVVHPPREHVYSLGYYRPGSRAPYQINWPEVRLDAMLVETAFITGLCFLIP